MTIAGETTKFDPTLDFIWKKADTIQALRLNSPIQHIDYARKTGR